MKERLYEILNEEKKHEIIPFLKQLTAEERKTLVPTIKKLDREINKIVMTKNSYHTAGSADQHSIIDIASFVCMDQKHYGKNYWSFFNDKEQTDTILEWGCPSWFSDFINDSVEAEFTAFNYQDILGWTEKGYIQPRPELLGHHLSNQPSDLEKSPETLKTHFWYLCEYPSKSLPFYKEWLPLVQKMVAQNKIDRLRFLKECLLAANRNFNKNVTGWFMEAFNTLKPTYEELLMLQDELLAGLASLQSKAVNTILVHLKKIVADPEFKTAEFSYFLPNLLSSEIKTVVVASLTVTEKILQKKNADPENIGIALSAAFVSKDESIQSKAAKIIYKHIPASEEMTEALSHYSDNILANIKPLLGQYIENKYQELDEVSVESLELISEETRLQRPESFEDLMFFLPQAIENPGTWYYDLALEGLIRFAGEEDDESVKLFEPVFQKACKTIAKWEVPYFNVILCNLIINYGLSLLEKYPVQLKNLEKIYSRTREDEATRETYSHYHKKLGPLEELFVGGPAMNPFIQIAALAFRKMNSGDQLPLLSVITHAPCWISPVILVERFEMYQKEGITPDSMDVQLAIQRCSLERTTEALQLAGRLKGEYRELLLFFFNKKAAPQGTFEHPAWWMTAGITRSPKTFFKEFENFGYDTIPKEFLSGDYSWKTVDSGKNSYYPVELNISIPKYHFEKREHQLFLEYFIAEQKEFSEVPLFMRSFPNTPGNVLARIIKSCLYYSGIAEVYERGLVLDTAQALHELKKPLDEMSRLFLGTIFLNGDKVIRGIAAEIWLEHVSYKVMNNKRLGEVIGLHEKLEWAPVKRFTDLIQHQMLNVSRDHNLALEELITHILLQMEAPVTNLKRILDIYYEVLSLNQTEVNENLKNKLDSWKENSSLKKICNLLLKK
jgi:hypothetical protein